MESKYSPGPWTFDDSQDPHHTGTPQGQILQRNPKYKVCDFGVRGSNDWASREGHAPDSADIALILAAPRLYELLYAVDALIPANRSTIAFFWEVAQFLDELETKVGPPRPPEEK